LLCLVPHIPLSTGAKLDQHIRRRFRQWLDASGQSQTQAGAAIEWGQQAVSSYFAGHQSIDLFRAVAWCDHFGYTLHDLLAKAPSRPADPRAQRLLDAFHRLDRSGQDFLIETAKRIGPP